MIRLGKFSKHKQRLGPTLALMGVVLFASWMGATGGGYHVGGWVPVVFILAAGALIASGVGVLYAAGPWRVYVALGLLAAHAGWTYASLLWSPNRGEAWVGAGQGLLYVVAFWLAV